SLSTTLVSRMKTCLATVSVCGLMIAVLLGGFGFVNVSLAQEWQFVPVGPPSTDLQTAVPNAPSVEFAIKSVDHTLDAVKEPSAVGSDLLRRGIDGINFLGSNCGCLRPIRMPRSARILSPRRQISNSACGTRPPATC